VWRTRSSRGVSLLTLHLTVLFGASSIATMIGFKQPALAACAHGPGCLASLLDALQQLAAAASWTGVLAVTLRTPESRSASSLLAAGADASAAVQPPRSSLP